LQELCETHLAVRACGAGFAVRAMTAKLDELQVSHSKSEQRFTLEMDGHTALITYSLAPGVISLDHTYVPPAIERQGVAAKLTRTALNFARAEKLRVVPACSYAADYVRKHPEYHSLVARTKS
jgi:uncharacterized protein